MCQRLNLTCRTLLSCTAHELCYRALPSAEPGGSPLRPCWNCCAGAAGPAELAALLLLGASVSMASSMPTSPSSSTQKGALLGFWPTVQANTCGLCTHRFNCRCVQPDTRCMCCTWTHTGDSRLCWDFGPLASKTVCMATSAARQVLCRGTALKYHCSQLQLPQKSDVCGQHDTAQLGQREGLTSLALALCDAVRRSTARNMSSSLRSSPQQNTKSGSEDEVPPACMSPMLTCTQATHGVFCTGCA